MTYYLGLIGLGLFLVLCVHIYNRWTIYQFQKHEKKLLFGFKNETDANTQKSRESLPNNPTNVEHPVREKRTKSSFNSHSALAFNSQTNPELFHKLFENISINNLEKVSTDNINLWLSKLITLPFITQIIINNKNSDNVLVWDFTENKKLVEIHDTISTINLQFRLTSRSGCLDLPIIKNIKQQLESTIGNSSAQIEIADTSDIATRAAALDEISAQFDVQVVLTLLCRNQSGVSGGQISKEALANGMVFDNGIFHKYSDEGSTEFTLEFHIADNLIKTLDDLENRIGNKTTMTLDIPNTKNGKTVFMQMSKFAQHLTAIINADLVDDRLQTLSTASLETIAEQVEQIQKSMQSFNFEPGSPVVKRIFM